eukprot:TRINITY_DN2786_c0_g1_i1.p1 TRINITY_DN2786_c0_g1~~TRINITY_DN2786_c0_g1_i1.p1  ORF type:complete len:376 (-),score=53.41 TRINITY_DN2786_c0_g1_i1:101-1228(-)
MEKSDMSRGKVLVTGVTGFLASHIAHRLLEKGYLVRGTVRDKSNSSKLTPLKQLPHQDRLEIFEANLLSPQEIWDEAVAGCDYVIHAASPFPLEMPKDESIVIKPAVNGVKVVLQACSRTESVKAVVVTSSGLAIIDVQQPAGKKYTEEDWGNLENNTAYAKSKVLAEKEAWEFYNSLGKDRRFRMTVINPAYILGPTLLNSIATSGEFIRKILTGELKQIPKLYFSVVDVRDVALAHVAAMETPSMDGKRYICAPESGLWLEEFAMILKEEFEKYGYQIYTEVMKECPIKDKTQVLYVRWGKPFSMSNERIVKELGMNFIDPKKAVIDMAWSFIKQGLVPDLTAKQQLTERFKVTFYFEFFVFDLIYAIIQHKV